MFPRIALIVVLAFAIAMASGLAGEAYAQEEKPKKLPPGQLDKKRVDEAVKKGVEFLKTLQHWRQQPVLAPC